MFQGVFMPAPDSGYFEKLTSNGVWRGLVEQVICSVGLSILHESDIPAENLSEG